MNNEQAKVIRILEDDAKHGVSSKTNKPWSMSRVELDNTETVFIFNPISVGATVTVTENNGFKNWQVVKADPKHDEIMKALREIYKILKDGS